MSDEIIAGLRNALERGQSLEQAARSFVNAGYNPQEVRAAVNELSTGISEIVYSKAEAPSAQEEPKPFVKPATPQRENYPQPTRPAIPPIKNEFSPIQTSAPRTDKPTQARPMLPSVSTGMNSNQNLNSLPPLPRLPGRPIEKIDTGVKSKWILLVIIICSLIFLAGAGYLAYYLMTQ